MGRVLRSVVTAAVVVALAISGSTAATAMPGGAVSVAEGPAAAQAAWIYPIPLDAAGGEQVAWRTIKRPRKRLVFPLSSTHRYQVRKATWRGWGGRRVKVRGEVRLCWSSCTAWDRGVIVLGRARMIECANGEQARYTRFRLGGFVGLSAAGAYRARASC